MKTQDSIKYVIGIDEAGRGPLAGPVAVGVCLVPINMTRSLLLHKASKFGIRKLNDSKKLSEKLRDQWLEHMNRISMNFSVCMISHKVIDNRGLSYAIRKAMSGALKKLKCQIEFDPKECLVLLDGGLRAPKRYKFQETIIKGDEKMFQISLASIAAKVTRDAHMKNMAKKHPGFHFEKNKGYGTRSHIALIKEKGISPIHRVSFLKRFI